MTQPANKRLVTEASLAALVPTPSSASTTAQGIVELATNTEATTGTDTTRAVTPAGVAAVVAPLSSAVVTAGKADGSDQSTVLQAAANALAALGGGTLLLPAGTVVGHVSVDAGVIVRGQGKDATTLQRPANWDGPVVQSAGYTTMVATSGVGSTHDMGCRDLTIDGNRTTGTFTAPIAGTKPATPTVSTSTTGGVIAAGTQWYRIAPVTAAGVGVASDPINQVTTGSTSTVTVSWSAITGATGYIIYGRSFNGTKITQVGAVTSWTDDGSLTPLTAVNFKRSANLTAYPAVGLYGWRPVLDNVRIRRAPGPGLHSCWYAPSGAPASGATMEAHLRAIHIEDCGTNSFVWEGPHDSVVHTLFAARPGQAPTVTAGTTDNVVVEGGGPIRFVSCHAWGQAQYGYALYGQSDLTNCQAEGALTGQILLMSADIHINGAEVFFPGVSTAKGVVIGTSALTVTKCQVAALHAYGFSTGAAVDMTFAGTANSVEGIIEQTTGTPITGSTPADAYVNLRVVGMAGGRFQVPGFQLSSGVDMNALLSTSGAATMTRRESNASLSGFSSGAIVGGLAVCQTAGTYTKARVFFTGAGTALTGAKIGIYDSLGTTKISETADFSASITAANAWVTVTLGASITLAVGDRIFLEFAETHTTTSVGIRGMGVQASSFWPQTTGEGVLQYRGKNAGTWAGGSNALPTSVSVSEGPGVMPLIELVP